MQGVGTSNAGVLILAATNFPENLDPAVRRRFEKKIEIVLPEWVARQKILLGCLNGIDNNVSAEDIASLEKDTDGYSASDLSTACKESIMMPIRDLQLATHFVEVDGMISQCTADTPNAFESKLLDLGVDQQGRVVVPLVTLKHLKEALTKCKKTVS